MPARAPLVINDQAATPVAHTFTPDGNDANGVLIFTEKTGVPAGEARVTLSLNQTNGKWRPRLKYQIPIAVTETINGVSSSKVDRTAVVDLGFVFDERSTEQERKDAVAYVRNSLANTGQPMIYEMITKLLAIY